VVPCIGKLPALFEVQDFTPWHLLTLTPIADVFFRPEEENRCSREHDVVPPASGRNRQMNHALIAGYSTSYH
jgi:hypothetical protein